MSDNQETNFKILTSRITFTPKDDELTKAPLQEYSNRNKEEIINGDNEEQCKRVIYKKKDSEQELKKDLFLKYS